MRWTILIIILGTLTAVGYSQDSDASQKCAFSGTVIDTVTGQPLKGAQVFARGLTVSGGSSPQPTSVITDASGHFDFEGLVPGRYILRASHEGYLGQGRSGIRGSSKTLSLGAGQRVDDLVVSLTPGGVVSGHVSDETGKPLTSASIELMRFSTQNGKHQLDTAANAFTDKTGEYRMSSLAPGGYYVRVTAPAQAQKHSGDKDYVPFYYPNTIDLSHAAMLDVRPGEEVAGVDVALTPVHTVHVRGRVVNGLTSLPTKGAEVSLLSDEGNTIFSSGEVSTDAKGAFEFSGAPPGSYIVAAATSGENSRQQSLWAKATVEIAENDVKGLTIVIRPGTDVRGTVHLEGKGSLDLGSLSGVLDPQEGAALVALMPSIDNASVKADGSFVFRDVPDGSYSIDLFPLPPGFYLQANGSDILENGITVAHEQALPFIDLVVSPATAAIEGTVLNNGEPAPKATVILVPQSKRQRSPRDFKSAASDQSGKFAFRDLPPGDYLLFAWEEVERGSLSDPDFLRSYQDRAAAVHLDDGTHASAEVDLIHSDSSP